MTEMFCIAVNIIMLTFVKYGSNMHPRTIYASPSALILHAILLTLVFGNEIAEHPSI